MIRVNIYKALSFLGVAVALVNSNHIYMQYAHAGSDYQIYNIASSETAYHEYDDLEISDDAGYSPGYFPEGYEMGNSIGISPAAIVGADNREIVENTTLGPYCNTVYIEATYPNGEVLWGSGFILGPSAVATAAHCIYDEENGGYAQSVEVVPAKNGNTEPYGSVTITASATNLVVNSDYIRSNEAANDWGIIELDTDIGNQTGWLGLRWQTASYNGTSVYNTGYPKYVNNEYANKAMYVGTGIVASSSTNTFIWTWDASAGNSGGPVYAYYDNYGYTAIGILTSGSFDSTNGSAYPTAYSTATRITEDMYNLFIQYR